MRLTAGISHKSHSITDLRERLGLGRRPRTIRRTDHGGGASLRLTDDERAFEYSDEDLAELDTRPRTRSECAGAARPCPWYGCRHHLGLDINPATGSVKLTHEDLDTLPASCSLDVAEDGGRTLEEISIVLNITRERVRQIETKASDAMNAALRAHRIRPDVLAGLGNEHTNSPL